MDLIQWDKLKNEIICESDIIKQQKLSYSLDAVQKWSKRSGQSLETQNEIAEYRIRLKRQIGIWIEKYIPKDGHRFKPLAAKNGRQQPTLKEIGIGHHESPNLRAIATIPEEEFEKHIAKTKDSKQELTVKSVQNKAKKVKKKKAQEKINKSKVENPFAPIISLSNYESWLQLQPDYDLLITDPPYMTDIDDISKFVNWLPVALSKLKTTGRAYIFVGAYPEEIAAYLSVANKIENIKLRQLLVWTYRNTLGPTPKYDYKLNWQAILYFKGNDAAPLDCPIMNEQFSVQDINAPDGRQGDRFHTWQKPDKIAERFIRHSTKENDLICDPFAGTGTFLLAAARLKRSAIGCDNNEAILKIAKERGCKIG